MKTCQFCAEEIRDAAIVCKHCGRDLVPAVVDRSKLSGRDLLVTPPPRRRGRTVITVVVLCLIGLAVASYFASDHQQFADWTARRNAWHTRCDQYVGVSTTFAKDDARAAAATCQRELADLTAEAKAHGWIAQ